MEDTSADLEEDDSNNDIEKRRPLKIVKKRKPWRRVDGYKESFDIEKALNKIKMKEQNARTSFKRHSQSFVKLIPHTAIKLKVKEATTTND